MRRMILAIAVVASLSLFAAACGNDETPGGGATGGAIAVTLKDFELTLSSSSAPAGMVKFDVTNDGPSEHEFVVFKTDLAEDALPVEGGAVNEEGAGVEHIDEIEEFPAGETMSKTFDLAAGKYVMICNLPGHYEQGMHASFEVTS